VNPNDTTPGVVPRLALGSKPHEGIRFDPQGNLYSISETSPGYIFRFVPDNENVQKDNAPSDRLSSKENNLSSGHFFESLLS